MRLAIISSIVAFASLIAAGPTPSLAARGPTRSFTLWARSADFLRPMLPQQITTYMKSSGQLTLALFLTPGVRFVWGSNRKVYTSTRLLTLVPGSPPPSDPGATFFDTVLVPEQSASDVELHNSEQFHVELFPNGEKDFMSTINGGRWYRCVDGLVQTIHHGSEIPDCRDALELILDFREESSDALLGVEKREARTV